LPKCYGHHTGTYFPIGAAGTDAFEGYTKVTNQIALFGIAYKFGGP
jgi:hypothetical protein